MPGPTRIHLADRYSGDPLCGIAPTPAVRALTVAIPQAAPLPADNLCANCRRALKSLPEPAPAITIPHVLDRQE